jgi:hypothetical protein
MLELTLILIKLTLHMDIEECTQNLENRKGNHGLQQTTTTIKPYPTKWGRLHGSNLAIMLYRKPNEFAVSVDQTRHLQIFSLTLSRLSYPRNE